jgi:hypothetical protein
VSFVDKNFLIADKKAAGEILAAPYRQLEMVLPSVVSLFELPLLRLAGAVLPLSLPAEIAVVAIPGPLAVLIHTVFPGGIPHLVFLAAYGERVRYQSFDFDISPP